MVRPASSIPLEALGLALYSPTCSDPQVLWPHCFPLSLPIKWCGNILNSPRGPPRATIPMEHCPDSQLLIEVCVFRFDTKTEGRGSHWGSSLKVNIQGTRVRAKPLQPSPILFKRNGSFSFLIPQRFYCFLQLP